MSILSQNHTSVRASCLEACCRAAMTSVSRKDRKSQTRCLLRYLSKNKSAYGHMANHTSVRASCLEACCRAAMTSVSRKDKKSRAALSFAGRSASCRWGTVLKSFVSKKCSSAREASTLSSHNTAWNLCTHKDNDYSNCSCPRSAAQHIMNRRLHSTARPTSEP